MWVCARLASVWPRLEGFPCSVWPVALTTQLIHIVLQAFWKGLWVLGGHSSLQKPGQGTDVTHFPWHPSLRLVCGSCFLSRGHQEPMKKLVTMWPSLELFDPITCLLGWQLPGVLRLANFSK